MEKSRAVQLNEKVQALLIWSEEEIQLELEGRKRNEKVYKKIWLHVRELGFKVR